MLVTILEMLKELRKKYLWQVSHLHSGLHCDGLRSYGLYNYGSGTSLLADYKDMVYIVIADILMAYICRNASGRFGCHSFTHSLTRSLAHSLTDLLTRSLAHSLTHSLTHARLSACACRSR